MKSSFEIGSPNFYAKFRHGRVLLGLSVVTLAVGASSACSSNETQQVTSGTAALCDSFFDALVSCPTAAAELDARGYLPQGLDKLPRAEIDRVRPLYRAHCADRAALPGSGFDASHVGACLAAIHSEGCVVNETTLAACTFKGTLPAGSACVVAEQCADHDCFSVSSCGGPPGAGATSGCGVCRGVPAIGEACDISQSCGPNAACVVDSSTNFRKGVCTPTATRGAGEACDGTGANPCANGLYCDLPSPFSTTATSTCKALASSGETCSSPAACQPPLVCSRTLGQNGKCQSSTPTTPGAAGANCGTDSDCVGDLGCVLTESNGGAAPPKGGTCQIVKFAEPGAACDAATRCRVGGCSGTEVPSQDGGPPSFSLAGTCPMVIADGGACSDGATTGTSSPNSTCDTLSSCVNGKCAPFAYPTCGAAPANAPLTCPDPLVVPCPSTAPATGDMCPNPTPATGQLVELPSNCSYDSGTTQCGCGPSITAPGIAWSCETCPTTEPTPGDACGSGTPGGPSALLCAYANVTCGCGGFGPGGSTWSCGSCPSSAPKSGDACDLPQGMECDFGGSKCTCSFGGPMPGVSSAPMWTCQ